ncbi:galactonate dehydratase [Caballeronia arvi]|uniref:Galactonate dehydratase n=1 Tax=Caballeronia arvi TaxID=1777135 RepID=A0A158KJ18_9BURK|nr:mandelate racemase/muconate lactonizing enzyme family protein [Caballeronia arvi]SAL80743.1 galactonate dehydratase [Caballeronia arvi]
MKIVDIKTTPLLIPYTRPYYWAHGVIRGASVILVEVHTDEGIVGYGESIASPSPTAIAAYIQEAAKLCIGRNPFGNARLMAEAYQRLFQGLGTCSSPRFSGQVFAGLEMALWDVMGKATGQPVHALLGGAVRDEIRYFGFAQGESTQEVVKDAVSLVDKGFDVIYFKVGLGDALDLETARAVRNAVGPNIRMRVDPNEHWTPIRLSKMARELLPLGVEVIEQPTHCESVSVLAQVQRTSPIPISADQSVFTPFDAFDVCRQQAADMIVVGLHETGGLTRMSKIAHIAEAAGINVCIHGLYETGITTAASNQIAATIPNLDDANQHMTRFLEWDIVASPDLTPNNGSLPVLKAPGLGFEIDWDAVERSKQAISQAS